MAHFTGSTYTTMALALERLNAMSVRGQPGPGNNRGGNGRYPTGTVIFIILSLSILYNAPRFFETTVETTVNTSVGF